MTVRVLSPGTRGDTQETIAAANPPERPAKPAPKLNTPASLPKFETGKLQLGLPLNSILQTSGRRT